MSEQKFKVGDEPLLKVLIEQIATDEAIDRISYLVKCPSGREIWVNESDLRKDKEPCARD